MEQIYEYMIKLIRYVLNGDISDLTEQIDFERLFVLGRNHGVENMLYVGLKDLKIDVPAETMRKFKTAYEMQIMVEATQALELEAIGEAFEEAGIDYIPLKGSVIKYLYPMPDYRKCSDIDILIHPEDKKRINRIMLDNGYTVDKMDEYELHEGYRKAPFVLVEIHDKLVEKGNRAYGFLANIWDYVCLKDGCEHQFLMDKEWFYTFTIAHLCKHIKNGGAGIKFIIDEYLMIKKWGGMFDNKKLDWMLMKSQLSGFNKILKEMCFHLFYDMIPENENVRVLEKFVLEGGSFGNLEQARNIKKSAVFISRRKKIKYFTAKTFKGIFVKYESMRKEYPILIKYKFLLPIMWIRRLLKIITDKQSMDEHIKSAYNVDAKEVEQLSNLWENVC